MRCLQTQPTRQGRLKFCPCRPWRDCQHWLWSMGINAPNARTPFAAVDQPGPDDLTCFLKATPDGRYRLRLSYPQWFLLLVAMLGIWRHLPGGCAPHHPVVFRWCYSFGEDCVYARGPTCSCPPSRRLLRRSKLTRLYCQIGCQFQGKRKIPLGLQAREASEHIKINWLGSAWIVEVVTDRLTRKGKRNVNCSHFRQP
jgi:hypothetical protein